jgi:hypothetical protein
LDYCPELKTVRRFRPWPSEAAPAPAAEDPVFAAFLAAQMADEAAMLANSTFPISPEDLIMVRTLGGFFSSGQFPW